MKCIRLSNVSDFILYCTRGILFCLVFHQWRILLQGANPNCVNRDSVPVLHVAVRNKHSEVIPVLVQAGASVNKKGPR